ncbi:MAG: 50S ribosomal protein L29 [Bacteroidota bacterium]
MKIREIREMTTIELEKRLQESRDSLGKLRFLHGTSQVESTALLRTTRRDVARILTVLHERQSHQAAVGRDQPA